MNKKVFIAMLVLTISFLAGLYVLKIFFPQEFMMSIQNEQLIKIGSFIDNHKWLYIICTFLTSFITYYLYCCACSHKFYLKWYECAYILIILFISRIFGLWDSTIKIAVNYSAFLLLPALIKGSDMKTCAIIYSTHMIAQSLSLSIRNLPIYLVGTNSLVSILMTIECFFWLILFYVLYNYKKENRNIMGDWCPPLYGKSKFYARKKEKTLKKIAGLQNKIAKLETVVEICDEKIAENEKKKSGK